MFRGVLLHARAPGISVLVCVAFVPDAGHICCSQASEKKHLPLHQKVNKQATIKSLADEISRAMLHLIVNFSILPLPCLTQHALRSYHNNPVRGYVPQSRKKKSRLSVNTGLTVLQIPSASGGPGLTKNNPRDSYCSSFFFRDYMYGNSQSSSSAACIVHRS